MYPITSTAAFQASYKNLAEIVAFVTKAAEKAGLTEGEIYAVQRAVDEACSNIIEHAYKGKEGGDIDCLCIACENGLIVRFHDNGAPFDPKKIPQPLLHTDIDKRPIGGLGLYFMHRLMDEVSFEFSSTSVGNTVTMVKYNESYFRGDIWPRIIVLAERLSKLSTLQEQCKCIQEVTEQLFHGEVSLWLSPGWANASATTVRTKYSTEPPTEAMSRAFQNRQGSYHNTSIVSPSGEMWSQHEKSKFVNDETGKTVIAGPLLAGEEILGVIQVERDDHPFSRTEILAFEGITSQAALSLSAARQVEVGKWRIEQLSLVRSVSAQIANVFDIDELARRVTHLILDTFNYYYAAIFTLHPGAEALQFRASSGPVRRNKRKRKTKKTQPINLPLQVHIGDGIIGLTVSTGTEILANDVRRDARYEFHDTLPETVAEVALPLKFHNEVLGVLDVQSDILDDFDESDMLVLRALADNIAIAVEGTQLYTALRRRADQLTSVSEVSNAITSILNLDDLLLEVIRLIRERLGYPYVQIFTVNTTLGEINYVAGSSPKNVQMCDEGVYYCLDDDTGLIPLAARNASTILVNEVEKDPLYRPSGEFPAEINSELVVPLVFGGQVHGILDVQSDKINAFSDEDRSLFEALAGNIAIAMRNAQLYRSEAWRRQVADSMHAVAGLLSAEVSLTQLLDTILTELERALPCDAAAIWLVEDHTAEEEPELPRFELAAIHSHDSKLLPADTEKALSELPNGRAWLADTLNATMPFIRAQGNPGDTSTDPFGKLLGFQDNYSVIAAPLRAGTSSLGVLTLAHHAPGRYGAESQAMTASFASYAAVAIENARLYEASHDQAWVSTVLLQVAEATQSLTDIGELLATVVQITPLLVGVNACALMMWDEDAEAFTPGAAQGLTADQQEDFDQWIVQPGEEPAFDQLREVKTPVLLPHWSFAKPVSEEIIPDDENQRTRPLVLFPMVVQDTVLGGMLVDFAGTEFRSEADFDNVEFIHDDKLAVIQGIAHQTAIAVENIRLLKAQKEEAYVSVALLQVAQAVVSLIDLHEILETIVRIAPILVGVNRCVIYLWDESRRGFWLAQSYGLPREVEDFLTARFYTPGEFPLLDVVYGNDRLAHIVLEDAPSQPTEWEHMSPEGSTSASQSGLLREENNQENIQNDLAVTDKGFPEEILKHLGCLLYAFPLSVKGTVLGVLLAEEAPPTSDMQSYHVRERRLEILTGITQQAALAIQNDRLQSEVVERERLEREMQLARSIQRTFLPQQLPKIPNWDLDMRWKTARQVGGDFYDLIDLPNQKLGLVIADVADKGMPAALFMTLVRTLIRAAVQDEESPATVLEDVNNLMIPDTQNGMFVTVIYAILDLPSGKMIYTNAGHNLPLLVRGCDNEVEPLPKGGIALGILKDIHLEDHEINIGPKDIVIFYTDGVTESFSPDDEMYGEERLVNTIRSACCDSANTMLDAIDNSLNQFTGDVPRADDLTMVAIRRVGA